MDVNEAALRFGFIPARLTVGFELPGESQLRARHR